MKGEKLERLLVAMGAFGLRRTPATLARCRELRNGLCVAMRGTRPHIGQSRRAFGIAARLGANAELAADALVFFVDNRLGVGAYRRTVNGAENTQRDDS